MNPVVSLSLGLVVATAISGAGCASANSNGRRYKETTTIHVVPVEPLVKTAGVPEWAVQAAVALAKFAIKSEAKKYEASSGASLLWPHGISPSNAVMIAVVRSFAGAADFNTRTVEASAADMLKQAEARLATAEYRIPEAGRIQFTNDLFRVHTNDSKLSIAVLLLAHPDATRKVMYFPLLGYSYPVLKAKNCKVKVPFTKWHSTESVLTLSIEGAQGRSSGDYKIQRVIGPKVLAWPRGQEDMGLWKPAVSTNTAEVMMEAPGIRSVPYFFPQGPLEISATLVESSDMKKTLEKLGDQVGKLKLGDLKK